MTTIDENTPQNKWLPTTYIVFLTSLICMLAVIAFVFFVPLPVLTSYLGYKDLYVLSNLNEVDSPQVAYFLDQLIKGGVVVDIKEVWSFQASLYQTLITFLIAINGLLAAVAVFYIKGTSEDKAEETTKKYIHGKPFDILLNNKLDIIHRDEYANLNKTYQDQLEISQADFASSADKVDNMLIEIGAVLGKIEILDSENQTLRQQLKIMSERLAKLDTSENTGSNLKIRRRR